MRAARETVEAHQAAIREGRKHPGEDSPSFEDRWLAACTNGHIGPDAAHRAAGRRGNHCETLVDGYTENGALAMATLGGGGVTGTVEGDLSRREAALHRARRDATPGNEAYSEDDRREDQDALISTAIDSHRRRFPDGLGTVEHDREQKAIRDARAQRARTPEEARAIEARVAELRQDHQDQRQDRSQAIRRAKDAAPGSAARVGNRRAHPLIESRAA